MNIAAQLDFDKAPADTSLRRNILDMIKSGQNMGAGYGVILFDGENIVNKNKIVVLRDGKIDVYCRG